MDGPGKTRNLPGGSEYSDRPQHNRIRCSSIEKTLDDATGQTPAKRHTRYVTIAKSDTGKWPFAKVVG